MSGSQPNGEVQGQPDDAEPNQERQAELGAAYEANVAAGNPPYAEVVLHTRGELRWALRERGWRGLYERREGASPDLRKVRFEQADLRGVALGSANLRGAQFYQVKLSSADLSYADLSDATFREVDLEAAQLTHTVLRRADLGGFSLGGTTDSPITCAVNLRAANLVEADLRRANLAGANLAEGKLWLAQLRQVDLRKANLQKAELIRVDLTNADLSGANLSQAHTEAANLSGANLHRAICTDAILAGADLSGARLEFTDLSGTCLLSARMDARTQLEFPILDSHTLLADVLWNGAPLTRVSWDEVPRLGDEYLARAYGSTMDETIEARTHKYEGAVLSYRQLAVALRNQGLNEVADHYAYRAQLMQRIVLRRQAFLRRKDQHVSLGYRLRKLTGYLGSGLLDLIAGYGYRPGRSLLAYILIILTFAGLYLLNGQFAAPHLRWDEALVLSVSSFHGRGFFTTDIHLGDTLARLAAGEAIVGLLIEITFIATFTQRFFSR